MIREGLVLILYLSSSTIKSTPDLISASISLNIEGCGVPLILAEVDINGFPYALINGVQK